MATVKDADKGISRWHSSKLVHRLEDDTAGQANGDHKDVVIASGRWQIFDKVHGDISPLPLGNRKGSQKSMLAVAPDLIARIHVAVSAKTAVVIGHSRPIELAAQNAVSTFTPRMPRKHAVMSLLINLRTERFTIWNPFAARETDVAIVVQGACKGWK